MGSHPLAAIPIMGMAINHHIAVGGDEVSEAIATTIAGYHSPIYVANFAAQEKMDHITTAYGTLGSGVRGIAAIITHQFNSMIRILGVVFLRESIQLLCQASLI